jgi:hypothetical protein
MDLQFSLVSALYSLRGKIKMWLYDLYSGKPPKIKIVGNHYFEIGSH